MPFVVGIRSTLTCRMWDLCRKGVLICIYWQSVKSLCWLDFEMGRECI